MGIIDKYFPTLTPLQKKQFDELGPLYKDWNEKINVISRKDIENFYLHHVLHSLSIAANFQFTKDMRIMDLGSGGGFPGLPLAIFFPETEFILVDSIKKKLLVSKEIALVLNLHNITTMHSRAEDIRDQKFDVITSRAVAPLKDLWHWSRPLLKKNKSPELTIPNGLICLKGGDLSLEVQESGCKPYIWEIKNIFKEDYFKMKYILYQPVLK